jgi:hypothetical protein
MLVLDDDPRHLCLISCVRSTCWFFQSLPTCSIHLISSTIKPSFIKGYHVFTYVYLFCRLTVDAKVYHNFCL